LKKEEHTEILQSILNAQDDATRAELVHKLDADYDSMLTEKGSLTEKYNKANEQATKYARLNNELILAKPTVPPTGEETPPNEPNEPKLTYDNLLKDMEV